MPGVPDPLAVDFANTRSSPGTDRIADVGQLRTWTADHPSLGRLADDVTPARLGTLLAQRDATQQVLTSLAAGRLVDADALRRSTALALRSAPLALEPGRGTGVAVRRTSGRAALGYVLAQSLVALLLGDDAAHLRACGGHDCLRVFVSSRPDRRWCSSQVCGNRARVAAFARRRADAN